MSDRLASVLVPFLFRTGARLPLPLLHALGAVGGWLAFFLMPRWRSRLLANMQQAGYRGHTFALKNAAHTGKALAELPYVWLRPGADVLQHVQVSGWELVEELLAKNQAMVVIAPHIGCFEIIAQVCAARLPPGKPFTAMYRPPRQKWLQPLMIQGRMRDNMELAPADISGVRRTLRALKRGHAIGMLPDQVPGAGEGVWVPYFGKNAFTMTLSARLLETSGTVPFLVLCERLPHGRGWHAHYLPFSQALQGTLEERTAQINTEMERGIRLFPEQYLWSYNRYKEPAGHAAAAGQAEDSA